MERFDIKNLESIVSNIGRDESIRIYDGNIYKEIPGDPGYWCSPYGEILGPSGRTIKLDEHYTGYYKVHLRSGKCFAHRVVMLTFQPNDNSDTLVVNHKDRNKKNNHIDNLEWVTPKQNSDHYRLDDFKKNFLESFKKRLEGEVKEENLDKILEILGDEYNAYFIEKKFA